MRRFLYPLTLALYAGCHLSNDLGTDAAASAGTTAFYYQSGGSASYSGKTATASTADQSGVCVANSGTLNLTSSTIVTSGSSSSTADSVDYGLNAAVLAKNASTINLASCSVTTSGTEATGAFATGSGSVVNLSDVTIMTTGAYGHGVAATLGGALSLADCTITTAGANAAAVGMDDGTGTVTVTGGTMTTSGSGSPVIHSRGTVVVQDGTLSASGSAAAEIQGGHSITLTGSSLSSTASAQRGVLIYQAGSNAAAEAAFTMTGGSLSAAGGPLFFVSNITGTISLKGVALTAGSGVLMEAGVTASWGAGGGAAVLTADGQAMTGNLITDDAASSISATLANGSTLQGVIGQAALTLDGTSKWTVTGTSRLTTLTDQAGISGSAVSNIVGNGHTVTYDATLAGNGYLAGATYTLSGGGQLLPE